MQPRKDPMTAALLGFFFGFLGLLYVMTFGEAMAWFGAWVVVSVFSGGLGVLAWPLAAFLGYHYAVKLNEGSNPSPFAGGLGGGAQCPQCRRGVTADAAFCTGCGYRLQMACGTCQRSFPRGTSFCAHCGTKLI